MGFAFSSHAAAKIFSTLPTDSSDTRAVTTALVDFSLRSTECISESFATLNNILLNEQGRDQLRSDFATAAGNFLGVLDKYLAGRERPDWKPSNQQALMLVSATRAVVEVTKRVLHETIDWNDWNNWKADAVVLDAVRDAQAFSFGYLQATAVELELDSRRLPNEPTAGLELLGEISWRPAPGDPVAKFFVENYIQTDPSAEAQRLRNASSNSAPQLASSRALPPRPGGTGGPDPVTQQPDPLRDPLSGDPDPERGRPGIEFRK
jgi:hypothetical protein